MPRGDGRPAGSRRQRRPAQQLPELESKNLAARRKWWDDFGTKDDRVGNKVGVIGRTIKYTNYDGILSFRRPGSQKK